MLYRLIVSNRTTINRQVPSIQCLSYRSRHALDPSPSCGFIPIRRNVPHSSPLSPHRGFTGISK